MVYTYYYVGSQLTRMTYGDYVLDFFYDINGTPIAMRNGSASTGNYTDYYYITNLQGDIIRVVDRYGNTAAYYEYDPYGNAIKASGSHANINPLRYRGYVYDSESGLYYLQSRYYDPKLGRFLNADALVSTGQGVLGNNMFAYCGNNPVNYSDGSGYTPSWSNPMALQDCGAGGGLLIGLVSAVGDAALLYSMQQFLEEISVSIRNAQRNSFEIGEYTVYVLIDKNDVVQYVGRTRAVAARRTAHAANPNREMLRFYEIAEALSYPQARGLEQVLMLYFHTINTDNRMNNQINGISIKNDNLLPYISAAESISGYIWNQISNEVLCWAGI